MAKAVNFITQSWHVQIDGPFCLFCQLLLMLPGNLNHAAWKWLLAHPPAAKLFHCTRSPTQLQQTLSSI